MQPSKEEEEKNNALARKEAELSETWRALLGLRPTEQSGEAAEAEGDPSQVQPLAADPWSHLINAQGMQSVDLQKIRLHDLYPDASDEDVEHALNLMREATGKLQALNDQQGEKGE